jgi:CubicO group peptidase (beta-lactamase class C family)
MLAVVIACMHTKQAFATEPIPELIPQLEDYVSSGMKGFDVPGVAVAIIADDRLAYAKGFGVRSKASQQPVDTETVFQIGSATKAFLAATMAIAVDQGKLHWDDRVIDLDLEFQLKDPWVTREFRLFDLLAQRSGLPPYANDVVGILGFDENAMIRSLRYVEPVSSFRSSFAYTNITHLVADRILAKAEGAADWNAVLRQELFEPLGMNSSSYTADGIKSAPNHAQGYRYTPDGSVEVPLDPIFPYAFGGAGDINSDINDMAHWVRLLLGQGSFEGRRIISAGNLAATRTPKVALSEKSSYALGWIITQTPNGTIVWHNGGRSSFGAYVGTELDRHIGVIVLTNESNVGFPDALGPWIFDRLLGNPAADYVAEARKEAIKKFTDADKLFAKPRESRAAPPLAPLAGNFGSPVFGKVSLAQEGDALVLALESGVRLKLDPWDGDIFTARLVPAGRFEIIAENLGPRPIAFVQAQMDQEGKLNLLRLSLDDGQAYDFRRE